MKGEVKQNDVKREGLSEVQGERGNTECKGQIAVSAKRVIQSGRTRVGARIEFLTRVVPWQ